MSRLSVGLGSFLCVVACVACSSVPPCSETPGATSSVLEDAAAGDGEAAFTGPFDDLVFGMAGNAVAGGETGQTLPAGENESSNEMCILHGMYWPRASPATEACSGGHERDELRHFAPGPELRPGARRGEGAESASV